MKAHSKGRFLGRRHLVVTVVTEEWERGKRKEIS